MERQNITTQELDEYANALNDYRKEMESRMNTAVRETCSLCCGQKPKMIESLSAKANILIGLRDSWLVGLAKDKQEILDQYKNGIK